MNAQVAAINKTLLDMSKKAQEAFAGISRGMPIASIEKLAAVTTSANEKVSRTAAGVSGAIAKVTSATEIYGKKAENLTVIVNGLNTSGQKVQQVLKGVGEAQQV